MDNIEYRSLLSNGKCALCCETILRNDKQVTILTFYKNGRYNSISICDDCLDTILAVRERGKKND